jgi:hypothetical protein
VARQTRRPTTSSIRSLEVLLHHRAQGQRIQGLARIPVAMWVYFGDAYVPAQQALKAFATWLGDPRASRAAARQVAREILQRLDNSHATNKAKRTLQRVVESAAYTRRVDLDELRTVGREVFEGPVATRIGSSATPTPRLPSAPSRTSRRRTSWRSTSFAAAA